MSADAHDRLDGIPHPRETAILYGHAAAEAELLRAYAGDRMPGSYLLSGPGGIGEATLAYRFARFLLSQPAGGPAPDSLDSDPAGRVARLVEQQAHPDLLVLTRRWLTDRKVFASEIRVDDVRRASHFLGSTAQAGGWRIVIIDKADEMNSNAANALLKILEEPPKRSVFLMVTERPKRLPATLRSRTREVVLRPLAPDDLAAAMTATAGPDSVRGEASETILRGSGGSVRRAIERLQHHEEDVEQALAQVLDRLPVLDRGAALSLADMVAARGGEGIATFVEGVLDHVHEQAVAPGLPAARLAGWAEVWENVAATARTADVFNLDRRPFVLSTLAMLAAAAR